MATAYRIAAVVLAAGASRRMGKPKAFLDAGDGTTFLTRILRTAEVAGLERRVVVTNAELAPRLGADLPAGAELLVNPDPGDGPITSIRVALRRLEAEAIDAIAIWPVDHPYVTVDAVRTLIAAGGPAIVVPRAEGRRGHPALFDRSIWSELLSDKADKGARAVVRADPSRVMSVAVSASVLLDIDTPEEYRRAVTGNGKNRDNSGV